MKARNVLLIVAGVLKTVVSSIIIFFSLLAFILLGLIRKMYEQSPDSIRKSVQELAKADPKYEYLLEYNDAQLVDFMMSMVKVVCLVALVFGLIMLAIGIFNFLFVKYQEIFLIGKKHKIIMLVCSWVCTCLAPSTILTTIALNLGRKKGVRKNKKKKDKDTSGDIESFQV